MLGVHVGLYASCCLFYIKTLLVLYIFLKSFFFIAVGGFRHRSGSSWCLLTLSISLSFSNGLRLSDWFKLHCLNRPDPVTVGQALWEKMQGFCLKCKQLKRKPKTEEFGWDHKEISPFRSYRTDNRSKDEQLL